MHGFDSFFFEDTSDETDNLSINNHPNKKLKSDNEENITDNQQIEDLVNNADLSNLDLLDSGYLENIQSFTLHDKDYIFCNKEEFKNFIKSELNNLVKSPNDFFIVAKQLTAEWALILFREEIDNVLEKNLFAYALYLAKRCQSEGYYNIIWELGDLLLMPPFETCTRFYVISLYQAISDNSPYYQLANNRLAIIYYSCDAFCKVGFFDILRTLRDQLGYQKMKGKGLCTFYAEKSVDAWLIGKEGYTVFQKRKDFIVKNYNSLPGLLTKPFQNNMSLTESEQQVIDIIAFIDQGDFYQNTSMYPQIFEKPLSQEHSLEISQYAQPAALEELGGRVLHIGFIRMYTANKLKQLTDILIKFAETASVRFSLCFSSPNHMLHIAYDPESQLWLLMLEDQTLLLPNRYARDFIATTIMDEFKNRSDDEIIGLETRLYTSKSDCEKLYPIVSALKMNVDFLALQKITVESCKQRTIVNRSLLLLASQFGCIDTLNKIIKEYPAINLNEIDGDGKTAVHIAIDNHQNAFLEYLINLKTSDKELAIDLDKANKNGWTPAHHAASNGNVQGLKILAENGADLFNSNKGITPKDCAHKNNHHSVLIFFEAWEKRNNLIIMYFESLKYQLPAKVQMMEDLINQVINEFHDDHQTILEDHYFKNKHDQLSQCSVTQANALFYANDVSIKTDPKKGQDQPPTRFRK